MEGRSVDSVVANAADLVLYLVSTVVGSSREQPAVFETEICVHTAVETWSRLGTHETRWK